MNDPSMAHRRELATALRDSEAWQEIILPHLATIIDGASNALLTKELKKKEASAHRAVRNALIAIRDLPELIAPLVPETVKNEEEEKS